MKRILLLACLFMAFHAIGQTAKPTKPAFKPLLDAKVHVGCYIEQTGGKVIANLSEKGPTGEPGALFNLNGLDLFFKVEKGDDRFADLYVNGDYKVYVTKSMIAKDPHYCLEHYRYTIKLVYKGASYLYRFKGFCSC